MAVSKTMPDAQIGGVFYPPVSVRRAKLRSVARPAIREDMHPGVYKAFVACWAGLLGVFLGTFAESPFTMFMLGVVIGYAIMFFGVPYVMSRVAPASTRVADVPFLDFLRGEVATLTGPVSGMEALLQVIMVPLTLTLGALAIGFVVHLEADHIHMLYIARSGAFPQ